MKEKLTNITINSLISVGIICALAITQATWDLDLVPKDLEQYIYGVFGAFVVLIIFLFLASFIYELHEIRKILASKKDEENA